MKLLAVRLARSIWLMPTYFLNPKGISVRPAIDALKIRYGFVTAPSETTPAPDPKTGYKFENGEFLSKNGPVIITSLTLHDDGIVIDTRSSTDDADAFMEDVINWISEEYGLPSVKELPAKRVYVSELNVMFPRAPIIFNPKLKPFLDQASSAIGNEQTGKAEMISFQLGTDPTRSNKQPIIRLEREAGTPFEENRYYSFAPVTTDAHLRLLEKLAKSAT